MNKEKNGKKEKKMKEVVRRRRKESKWDVNMEGSWDVFWHNEHFCEHPTAVEINDSKKIQTTERLPVCNG